MLKIVCDDLFILILKTDALLYLYSRWINWWWNDVALPLPPPQTISLYVSWCVYVRPSWNCLLSCSVRGEIIMSYAIFILIFDKIYITQHTRNKIWSTFITSFDGQNDVVLAGPTWTNSKYIYIAYCCLLDFESVNGNMMSKSYCFDCFC